MSEGYRKGILERMWRRVEVTLGNQIGGGGNDCRQENERKRPEVTFGEVIAEQDRN